MSEKKNSFVKRMGSALLDVLASCLMPLIPVLIAAAMLKTIAVVIAPGMLNIVSANSDLVVLLTFVSDAGFYFLPVMIGYTAAKHFGCNELLGMFLGAILLHPTFLAMAENQTVFTVYGIPCRVTNYASSIIPAMLSVYVFSFIETFFNEHLPKSLAPVFAPTLSILIMLPLSLCLLAPMGSLLGEFISKGILMLGDVGGIGSLLSMMIIAALWEFIVMAGMHWIFITTIVMLIAENGYEALVSPPLFMAAFTVGGMALGAALRIKDKEQKALCISYLVAQMIGGVTEPGLYGVGVRYHRPFIGMMVGGIAGAIYMWIMGTVVYNFIPVASVLCLLSFVGGSTMNVVHAIIGAIIAFVVAMVVTYFLGIDESIVEKEK